MREDTMAKAIGQTVLTKISKTLEDSGAKIFRRSELQDLLSKHREGWGLPKNVTLNVFVTMLLEKTATRRVVFDLPYRRETRFLWGNPSPYEVILSLKPAGYFSHYTAMFLHQLTEQVPKTFYLNTEQPPKPPPTSGLEQERIDAAFRRSPRVSKNCTIYEDRQVCLLNGMHTGRLGVIEITGSQGPPLPVTCIERTLIDIAVRPIYAGGVFEVLKAYRLAAGRTSTNRLAAMLAQLRYVYPYHQVIGFYLERAGGYKPAALQFFRKLEMKWDFYLAHDMGETDYCKKWRLFIPKGF
jgi:hypothetical protein